ncbi:hypothetical protein WICMUC_001781 [Wickerhamomyces mucosus]|uniref:Uncharacterized protein n=1 Tax=Wickerhamomyces mucosus TaxID=1378264 RepID=A0A9P8PT69_9ASCO|nr:hypothetical protein WICMUC_001781 [Wickerhamomyces mucosus]
MLALVLTAGVLFPIKPPIIDNGISKTDKNVTNNTTVPNGKALDESLAQTTQFKIRTADKTRNGKIPPNKIDFEIMDFKVCSPLKFL